jgi:peptidoglycan/xylan/chitin deacetylase (PgdA/CDA1 family)
MLGVTYLVREIILKNKVTIIVYHDPPKKIFQKHIKYIAQKYNIISLSDFIKHIYCPERYKLPLKSMVITFDDGHRGNFLNLDIIKNYKIKPTIFLCSSIVNTKRHFWWMHYKKKADLQDINHLKKIKNYERLDALKKYGFSQVRNYKERHALNLDELNEMKKYIEIGAHTCFHPILTNCSYDECHKEIVFSKKEIDNLLNINCNTFAYPNGDYTKREIMILKKSGFLCARTTKIGFNHSNTPPFELKSIGIYDYASVNWLKVQLTGIPGIIKKIIL